MTLSNFET